MLRRALAFGSPIAIGLAVGLLVAGCGGRATNRAAIHGEATLDGQPITQGSIVFTPAKGVKGTVAGGQIIDGHYHLTAERGPAIGWNHVEINSLRATGKMVPKPFGARGDAMVNEMVEAVAPQFNSATTLKTEVKLGDNTADFDTTSR